MAAVKRKVEPGKVEDDDAEASRQSADALKEKADQDHSVEVDLDEDEEDEDEDGRAPQQQQQQKPERRNRYREQQERADRMEREAEEERAARRRAEEESHQARLRAQELERGGGRQQDPMAEVDRRHQEIFRFRKELYNAARLEEQAGALTQERQTFYDNEARKLSWAEHELVSYAQQMRSAPQQAQQAREHYIRNQYPDIVANPAAVQAGLAIFNYLVNAEGFDANSNATLEETAKRVRDNPKFGLKKAPPPTAAERQRLSGLPRGASNGSAPVVTGKMRVTKEEQKIAVATYPDDAPEVAIRKWAKAMAKRKAAKEKTA